MDLTQFDTKDVAEAGRPLHMRHPFKKHLLYVGEGAAETGKLFDRKRPHEKVTITVRGWHSETISSHFRALASEKLRNETEDDDPLESADEKTDDLIDMLVIGWENVTDDAGEPLPCDRKNKIAVVRSNSDFERQVVNFAQDQANFFGKPARG